MYLSQVNHNNCGSRKKPIICKTIRSVQLNKKSLFLELRFSDITRSDICENNIKIDRYNSKSIAQDPSYPFIRFWQISLK